VRDDSQHTPRTDAEPAGGLSGPSAALIVDGRGALPAQGIAITPAAATETQDSGAHTEAAPAIGEASPTQRTLLRAVYEENLTAVYRFIYSKVGNREEAEDLTSQVFIKALRGIDQARDAQSIQRWLFQVARTTVADHWRAFYRLPSRSLDDLLAAGWEGPSDPPHPPDDSLTDDPHAGADEIATAGSAAARAQRILAQLPSRYRDVLTYRFLLSYSLKETAAQMKLTEANVKVLQFRALKKASQIEAGTQSAANMNLAAPANPTTQPSRASAATGAPPEPTAATALPDTTEYSPL